MTVRDLINWLETVEDKSRIVILQKDSEGNGYSPASGVDQSFYEAETTWNGFVDDDNVKAKPCIVLWPVN
jgi:hypothetical protein